MDKILLKNNEKRTLSQNDALHLWLTQISEILNEQGITMKQVMEVMKQYEVKPTMIVLKENVWKPIQKAMFGTESTTELLKSQKQIDDIIDVMTGIFTKMEVSLPPFPSLDEQNLLEELKKL